MKKQTSSARPSLTMAELEKLPLDELLKLKLTKEEKILLRELNSKKDLERMERVKRLLAESELLLRELQATGLNIKNVGELPGVSERYEKAIPILLRHLLMPYSDPIRSIIARSLAVPEPEVIKAWPMLVDEYRKTPMGKGIKYPGDTRECWLEAKDGLACTLSVAVTDETMEEYIEIVKDKSHGESRILLLSALRKSKNPLAKKAIEELASDPDLEKEIASWKPRKKKGE